MDNYLGLRVEVSAIQMELYELVSIPIVFMHLGLRATTRSHHQHNIHSKASLVSELSNSVQWVIVD
jgi:hypothetical protein